jgi:hypothetical protein
MDTFDCIMLIVFYLFQLIIVVILFLNDDENIFHTKRGFLISLLPLGFLYPTIIKVIQHYKEY